MMVEQTSIGAFSGLGRTLVSVDRQRDLYLRAHPSGGVVVLCDGT